MSSTPSTPLGLATINFAFSTHPALMQDYDWWWRSKNYPAVCTLIESIDDQATTIKVDRISLAAATTTNQPPYGQPTVLAPAATITTLNCITIDDEPMTVSAISAPDQNGKYTLTVVRGKSQATAPNTDPVSFPFATPVAHTSGAAVNLLKESNPWVAIHDVLKNLGSQAVQARGMNSAFFTSIASGTIVAS